MKIRKQINGLINILILVFGFGIYGNTQSMSTNYIGVNLIPILGNTMELGYDLNLKPNLSLDLYTGYVFNSRLGSPFEIWTQYDLENKSGFFIKLGTKCSLRDDFEKFAPFIGFNIVNSIAIEKGTFDSDLNSNTTDEPVSQNSYNLGFNGLIGITSPATKKINFDIGFQFGFPVIDNLLDLHSYLPGMGVNFNFDNGLRIQGVLRIKYLIN